MTKRVLDLFCGCGGLSSGFEQEGFKIVAGVDSLSSKEFDNNIEKSSNAMIANCVLAGDQELLNNDASVFTELVEKIGSLTKSARSSLKKV